ncbi:MAG: hypothetical protein KO463_06705, partial [Candidatus Methanofastidiosa archaeon]|nr:hypothetical protein [Candidatus Methanofastidiosa archaeon]
MKKPILLILLLIFSFFALLPIHVSSTLVATISPSGGDDTPAVIDAILGLEDGGTVFFGAGTYHVNLIVVYFSTHPNYQTNPFLNRDKSFSLVGAGQGVTILDGDITGDGVGDGSIFQFLYMGDNVVTITGVTLSNGRASCGGAIYNYDSSMSIYDCTFENNDATDDAGAVCIVDNFADNSYSLDTCTFTGNTAGDNGGALALNTASPTITNCVFVGNTAGSNGGGMHVCNPSYPFIEGCMFIGNTAGKNGGGMMNGEVSAPTVKNCTFSENHAGIQPTTASQNGDGDFQVRYGYGGGMMNAYKSAPVVSNCVFSGNTALWAGAGISNSNKYSATPVITNCVFVQNEVLGVVVERAILAGDAQAPPLVSGGGGGMFVGNVFENVSAPVVTNCTFTQNAVPYYDAYGEHNGENGGGVKNDGGAATFTNCIVWGNFCGENPNDILNTDGNASTFRYCNIGGGYPGEGNIDADPLFVNAPTNVSLRAASPCVNTGTDTSAAQYGSVIDDILGV